MAMTTGKAAAINRAGPALVYAAIVATQLPTVVAAKFNPNVPLFPDKYVYVISRILGVDLTRKLVANSGYGGNFTPSLAQQGISIFGWANSTTFGGAVILIVDYFINQYGKGIIPHYSTASRYLKAAGAGLLTAGFVGGLLDPPAAGSGGTSSRGSGGFAFANAALGRSVMGYTGVS